MALIDCHTALGERVASNYMKPEAMYLQDPMEAIRTADWGIVRLDDNVTATNLSQSRDWNGRSHGEPVRLTTIKDYRTLAPGDAQAPDLLGERARDDRDRQRDHREADHDRNHGDDPAERRHQIGRASCRERV